MSRFCLQPTSAIASVQPGSRILAATSGTTIVAKNMDKSDVFSTVYLRITRYCSPKAPPATAAMRMKPKPIRILESGSADGGMKRLSEWVNESPGEPAVRKLRTGQGE